MSGDNGAPPLDLSIWRDLATRYGADPEPVGHDLILAVREGIEAHPRTAQKEIGPSELGHPCLSGDTEIVTREGIRPIRDLAREGSAELLVPLLYKGSDVRKRWGKFVRVPVESFGEQRLYAVSLRRGQDTKTVLATAEHGWFRSYWSGKNKKQERLTTTDLRPGHRLTQLRRARSLTTTLMPVAVAQGFTFGDGTKGSDDDRHRPAVLNLYHNGKDEALLKYFPGDHPVYQDPAKAFPFSRVTGLPRFWKALPPLDESTSFLMSWLAGYFAADGSVGEDGHCTISSANETHLEFVQSAAAICGVGYGLIRKYMRRGISGSRPADSETPLYRLSLRRRDLPEWFFLTARHSARAQAASAAPEQDPHWIVKCVQDTGRTEEVFCAVTGEPEAFALADDLMTGNCNRWLAHFFADTPPTGLQDPPWRQAVGTAVHSEFGGWLHRYNAIHGVRFLTDLRVYVGDLYPGRPIYGTLDAIDLRTATTIDLKVVGATALKTYAAGKPESPQYDTQVDLYSVGATRHGFPVASVGILRLPAAGELAGATWKCRPHDPARAHRALARAGAIAQMVNAIGPAAAPLQTTAEHYCNRCPYFAPNTTDLTRSCPGDAAWIAKRDARPDPLHDLIASRTTTSGRTPCP